MAYKPRKQKLNVFTDEDDLPEELPKFSPQEEHELNTQDGVLAMYIAQNRKLNEVAKAIGAYTLKLDGDDKGFERWHKISTTQKDLVENLEFLRGKVVAQYGTDQVTEDKLKDTNILEAFIKDKKKL